MTLNQLKRQIDRLIQANNESWPDENRNDLPIRSRIDTFGKLRKTGRRSMKSKFITFNGLDPSMYGSKESGFYMVIKSEETTGE